IELPRAGSSAQRFLDPNAGWELVKAPGAKGDGGVSVSVANLKVPFQTGTTSPKIDQATGRVEVKLTDWAARPRAGVSNEAVVIKAMTIVAGRAGMAPARVEVNSAIEYGKEPFAVAAGIDVPGLFAMLAADSGAANGKGTGKSAANQNILR